MQKFILIKGAREHNLKNIDISIPRDAITVITGPSGSGKSSLAIDTIFAEDRDVMSKVFPRIQDNFWNRCRSPMLTL